VRWYEGRETKRGKPVGESVIGQKAEKMNDPSRLEPQDQNSIGEAGQENLST